MWEYILGGATIFGLIVGLFSWYNGRLTRKEVTRLIEGEDRRTRELIKEEGRKSRELLEKPSEQHMVMIKLLETLKSSKP